MVGQMTYGKRQFEDLDKKIRQLLPPLHGAMQSAIPMIDADTDAFNDYMACFFIFICVFSNHYCPGTIVVFKSIALTTDWLLMK